MIFWGPFNHPATLDNEELLKVNEFWYILKWHRTMHHKYTKTCNGRTQVFYWYSATPLDGAPPKNFVVTDFG